ncbi:MAG: ATP-grasp domain-containing protein, partial [Planctomycetota bacterium]|nr:ATP-grasp domain-containing protein [Planctomycetota bacterium]
MRERKVVFVAPFLAETTLRFVAAVAKLPGVRMALVTQDQPARVPAGLRPHVAFVRRTSDAFGAGSLLDAVREAAAKIGGVDRVIGTLEQLQVPLAQVREALGVEGVSAASAEAFRDKSKMKDVLRAAGVPCARHQLVESVGAARAFAADVGFPLVVKPPDGAGAKATYRVSELGELTRLIEQFRPGPGRPVLLEEFVTGEEHSFDTVSIRGKAVWHSLSHYDPTPLDVLENPWIQWCVLIPREIDHPHYDDIRAVAAKALRALGMHTGVSHMEWFRRRDGSVAVSEVGARPPGAQICSLISYAHDIDFYAAWGKLVVYDTFEFPQRKYACGAAYLRGQGEGRVRGVHGLEQAQKELGPLVVEARLPRPGQPAASGYEGEGYVILRHPDTGTVKRALERLIRTVQVELG